MAFVLAEGAVKKVCEMAIQQAANEVSIAWNFSEEFELFKSRIELINCVLSEADEESSRQKESAKKWLHRVRDIAWEAQDILEECAVKSMYATRTHLCILGCNQLTLRHQMGRRIQKLKARISSVLEEGNLLNITHALVPRLEEAESSSRSQTKQLKRSNVLPRDSKPVGIQSKVESLLSLLKNPAFPVIAVVGMGGIGKTYLLQHLYNGERGRYEMAVWLSVSQFYSVSKLQSDIAFQLGFSDQIQDSKISEELVAGVIHDNLLGKRCLIVLDDVWRATREGDLLTKLGIRSGDNSRSKILVSTRSREVCVNLDAKIYEMEYLSDQDCWRLFCAYAFPGSEGNRPPQHLEKVAHEILKECGNLPLAIKTTAASLASIILPCEWQSKLSNLKKVGTPKDSVTDILKLSYNSLPAHLKACFAYLSFFSEDEQIKCPYLIYLWMGEGFIPTGEDQLDMAWDCLYQLANLCLVEVWENKFLNKYCKIHDLLLDLAILVSTENKCAFRVEDAFSKLPFLDTRGAGCCRLLLARKDIGEDAISEMRHVSPTLVRTITLSSNINIGRKIPAMLFSGMKVLRVLDLSHTNISTLPACVGKMGLLKVLNLSGTNFKKVPNCVRYLKSLSFLSVSGYPEITHPPKWIAELKCLQHLRCQFERMPKGMSKLESLRTLLSHSLSLAIEDDDSMLSLEGVGRMTNLQEIGFTIKHESQLKRMEQGILAPLKKMRRLRVSNWVPGMFGDREAILPQFPENMKAMGDLEHLRLSNFAVPSWVCCLANLRYLYLWHCHCSNYPELQEMPNLVTVWLEKNRACSALPKAFGKLGGFPHLRFLWISDFPELEEFPELEDGAMVCLEEFLLEGCEKVNKMGGGLEKLKKLREFNYRRTGTCELRGKLKEGGIYWNKIKANNSQVSIFG